MEKIYKSVSSFENTKVNQWDTTFKVNKAHEIENKILPRILARDPKWIVSYKQPDWVDNENMADMANAIRVYLQQTFKKQDLKESMRIWAKNMVRYGQWRAKIWYKYRINRSSKSDIIEDYDEEGNIIEKIVKKVNEDVSDEYSCIDIKSWTDVLFDPRYTRLEDMPAIIETVRNARLSYFAKNKSKYMNIDQIVSLAQIASNSNDYDWYRNSVKSVTGINITDQRMIKPDTLDIKCYYWYYDLSEKDDMSWERLYEFRTINDTVLIYAQEISFIPFEDIRCFEDTETYFSVWFIEPMLGLQDELNYKKNATATYINQSLNRQWIRSPNSWIDPRKLNNAPGNIITTTRSWQEAMQNLVELPHRSIPSEYFMEQNDFERQIQGLTFTVDTAQPLWQQSLTNTATGAKIKAFESNAVVDEVRKHFEEWLERLAYKFLQHTFDNLEGNITIQDDKWDFRQIHKEAMRDAINKYEIKVEAWSSSFDSEETRREVAIAKWNLLTQAMKLWLPVNLKDWFADVWTTFEWADINKLYLPDNIQQRQPPIEWWVQPLPQTWSTVVQPVEQMDNKNIPQLQ